MDSLVKNMFTRCCNEAGELVLYGKKNTMQTSDMQGAVQLVFHRGELVEHAKAEGKISHFYLNSLPFLGQKAVVLYNEAK